MRILFLHNAFPGQYRHLASALAADSRCQVVFASAAESGDLPGVERRRYALSRPVSEEIHYYLRWAEGAVLTGQAVYRLCRQLAREGFVPDVVCAHAGWGPALYVKDAFPNCRLIGLMEWYYNAHASDADYLEPMDEDDALRLRSRNATLLLEAAQCDLLVTPTQFQAAQFPPLLRPALTVLHEGVDTDYFTPRRRPPNAAPVVTYATRGMEPYRGFPQFMRALAILQRRHPTLRAVIAGEDEVFYGKALPEGESWKHRMLTELPGLDLSRTDFVGKLPISDYRELLWRSDLHVYLTVPFVLSWSLLEAMACGCLILASDTAPVREVMEDGVHGLLADFRDPAVLAARMEEALGLGDGAKLGAAARGRAVERYGLAGLMPRQMALVRGEAS